MKNKLTIILLFTTLIGSILNGSSQNVVAQRQHINEYSVPKIVTNSFKKQYPHVLLKGWYVTHLTYWQNDYSSDWYTGWYGQRSFVIFTYQKPNYFEVEFLDNPTELSRAIYNINGYWYETRTQIKVLTIGILDALKESEYDGWKISAIKEKLQSPGWPVEIYRFQVSKGTKAEIIQMDAKGNFIQIRELQN